ncbi:MAG: hypothetical protein JAY96_20390, partial [Candidatus Thiodiazotropha endolucinida]|nr:hypothetical protein [Candidatus Thiodiazotropha taylori]MCW4250552.1 hypothetical protein [Candidatus Thiodiazotropha endolucinida]
RSTIQFRKALGYNSQHQALTALLAIMQHGLQLNGSDGNCCNKKTSLTGDKYQRHPDIAGI